MNSNVLVELNEVVLEYPILNSHNMNLKGVVSTLLLGNKRKIEKIEALSGISTRFESGERILLAGQNGAGKTTLLKIISGSINPTRGQVTRSGSCLTLLDFTSSFDSHLTGNENITRMGILLGATSKEISSKVSEISEFTGLGLRLRHPIFTYSAGMKVRLSFSVATSFPRDVVIIDEGLGFADSEFMARASERLDSFVKNSGIIVLASHSAGILESKLTRRIELKDGRVVGDTSLIQNCDSKQNSSQRVSLR